MKYSQAGLSFAPASVSKLITKDECDLIKRPTNLAFILDEVN